LVVGTTTMRASVRVRQLTDEGYVSQYEGFAAFGRIVNALVRHSYLYGFQLAHR
jgi:hypothetical protein